MDSITIKQVEPGDSYFLYQLMNAPQIMSVLNEFPTSRDDWADAVACWETDDDELDFIVWSGDRQVGWFAFNGLSSSDKTVYLKMAAILPEYQHRGIGTHVLSQLLDVMKEKNFAHAILFTNQDNESAQRCYQKCGFKVTEKLTQTMADGTETKRYKMECIIKDGDKSIRLI
jgi:ribosomal protein S18 acetylase RimI-like enzyme